MWNVNFLASISISVQVFSSICVLGNYVIRIILNCDSFIKQSSDQMISISGTNIKHYCSVSLLHTMACFMWSPAMRSHSWYCVVVQNSCKCKPTKVNQINIKCIVCHTNNNKLVFNRSVENTFIVVGKDILPVIWTHQVSQCIKISWLLHRHIEYLLVLIIVCLSRHSSLNICS